MVAKFVFGMFLILATSAPSFAHNQSPSTIRRSMEKAYKTLDAAVPGNVLKGQRTQKVAGATAQIFDAKKGSEIVGYVAQLEYQEQLYVVALDKNARGVKSVVRDGSLVEEAEWRDLPFVDALNGSLFGSK